MRKDLRWDLQAASSRTTKKDFSFDKKQIADSKRRAVIRDYFSLFVLFFSPFSFCEASHLSYSSSAAASRA